MKKTLQRFLVVVACQFLAAHAVASPLGGTFELHDSAQAALKSVAGTSRHVLILFSDYSK